MRQNLFTAIYLKPAMEQSGCPICRVKNLFEERYLSGVLNEYVNDFETRMHIFNSLGYCTKHAWQMGMMESKEYGDAVGNSIIYESLIKVILDPLASYQKRFNDRPHSVFQRFNSWLRGNGKKHGNLQNEPLGDLIQSTCRVCQAGSRAEQNYLGWLLEGLSEPEPELREKYKQSDGLCLAHFRQTFTLKSASVESGIQFLLQRMLEALPTLCTDLREYTDKHAWNRHMEAMTPNQRVSWIRAIRFFAGNEGNILMDEIREIPPDDRSHQEMKGKDD